MLIRLAIFASIFIISVYTLIVLITGNYSQPVNAVTDGLVGYWKLNESVALSTVADSSGDGRDGTSLGTPGPQPTIDVPSTSFNNPYSLSFAGADYVEVADEANLDVSVFTISLWIKVDDLPGADQTIFAKWEDTVKQQFMLQLHSDGTLGFWTDDGTNLNPTELSSTAAITADTWYHVAVTVDANARTIFLNGNGNEISDSGEVVGASDTELSFGANQNNLGAYTNFFDGYLDDVRFYNRILSDNEINILASGSELNIWPSSVSVPVLPFSAPGQLVGGGPPACTDLAPIQKPDLFQIDANYTSVDLYFTTTVDHASAYEVYYGEGSQSDRYSTRIPFDGNTWITKLKIASLSANQPYSFKVRAATGCNAGDFGNTIQVKTLSSTTSATKKYYKSVMSQIAGNIANPFGTGCQYVVKGGDSFWSIAATQLGDGKKYLTLMAQNPTLIFRTLRPGMVLNISCNK